MNMEGIMKYVILAAILMTMTISVSSYADDDIRPDLPSMLKAPLRRDFKWAFPDPRENWGTTDETTVGTANLKTAGAFADKKE